MLGSQQCLALTLVLIDLGKLRLQVFQLALERATMAGQEMQEALDTYADAHPDGRGDPAIKN